MDDSQRKSEKCFECVYLDPAPNRYAGHPYMYKCKKCEFTYALSDEVYAQTKSGGENNHKDKIKGILEQKNKDDKIVYFVFEDEIDLLNINENKYDIKKFPQIKCRADLDPDVVADTQRDIEKNIKIIRDMKKNGIPIAKIAEHTGLTEEKIKSL